MKKTVLLFMIFALLLSCCGAAYAADAVTKETLSQDATLPENSALVAGERPVAGEFAGGDGTAEDPYQIATAEQLAYLSYLCSDEVYRDNWSDYAHYSEAWYVLTEDIELNDTSDFASWGEKAPKYAWKPIGEDHVFAGVFDGQGHSVRGMYVYSAYQETGEAGYVYGRYPGLFGQLVDAEIRNLRLEESYVHTENCVNAVGGVAAQAMQTVFENCVSAALVRTGGGYTGGVVGWCQSGSRLIGCEFVGEIHIKTAKNLTVGGVAGFASCQEIRGCRSDGVIVAEVSMDEATIRAAGLVCAVSAEADTLIRGCVNETDLDLGAANVGGLFQSIDCGEWDDEDTVESMTISDCVNNGDLISTGSLGVGGLAMVVLNTGHDGEMLIIENCANNGNVTGTNMVGGLFGYFSNWNCPVTVRGCINNGTVSGLGRVGGISGVISPAQKPLEILDCTNNGAVFAEGSSCGGIAGDYFISTSAMEDDACGPVIRGCVNRATVTVQSGISGVGGILGCAWGDIPVPVVVDRCANYGLVGGMDTACAGGIVGREFYVLDSISFEITNCVNYGDVTQGGDETVLASADNRVTERLTQAMIESNNGESAAFVLGGSRVGGIVGDCRRGRVENCVNAGRLFVSAEDQPVYSYEELVIVTALAKEDLCGGAVFAGGICAYFEPVSELAPGEAFIRECWYEESVPGGAVLLFDESQGIAENLTAVDMESARNKADEILAAGTE